MTWGQAVGRVAVSTFIGGLSFPPFLSLPFFPSFPFLSNKNWKKVDGLKTYNYEV